jgi:regulator of RNase E activity RraA
MTITQDELAALAALDTPTVCNAVEVVMPERRGHGFTRRPLVCPFPDLKPVVGFARTATVRGREPWPTSAQDRVAKRLSYYEYLERGPRPYLTAIQDLDGEAGFGAFWGEVQTNVHKALGCFGVVTDGPVRDIDMMAANFFVLAGSILPSHGYVDIVDFDVPVTIAEMPVAPGDLIHADRHGAIVVPAEAVREVPKAAALIGRREKAILDAAAQAGFSTAHLRRAFAEAAEIH